MSGIPPVYCEMLSPLVGCLTTYSFSSTSVVFPIASFCAPSGQQAFLCYSGFRSRTSNWATYDRYSSTIWEILSYSLHTRPCLRIILDVGLVVELSTCHQSQHSNMDDCVTLFICITTMEGMPSLEDMYTVAYRQSLLGSTAILQNPKIKRQWMSSPRLGSHCHTTDSR